MSDTPLANYLRKELPDLYEMPEPANVPERLAANGAVYRAIRAAIEGTTAAKAYDLAGIRKMRGGTTPFCVWLSAAINMAVGIRSRTLARRTNELFDTALEYGDIKVAVKIVDAEQTRIAKREELEAKQDFKRELLSDNIDASTEYLRAAAAAMREGTRNSRAILADIMRPAIADTTITVEPEPIVVDEVDKVLNSYDDVEF